MNSHLADAAADSFDVAGISVGQPGDATEDDRPCRSIANRFQPCREFFGLLDFDHIRNVYCGIQIVKQALRFCTTPRRRNPQSKTRHTRFRAATK